MTRTILIVDDINANREILKKILGGEYSYKEASDGQQALDELLRSYDEISAVLLDLTMPVMDGFEVLSRMRRSEALLPIPVIVMTSNSDAESEERALAMGASDYIAKPYNATIVRQRLRNMINLRETAATINAMQRDRLTGLYSREAFFEKVAQEIKGCDAGYFTLSCFNIDSFKVINDQYGTETGDRVLRHVADIFAHFCEEVGGICCRIMADNFAMLFPTEFVNSPLLRRSHREVASPGFFSRAVSIRIGRYRVDDLSLSPSAMYDRASLAERSIKGRYDVFIANYDEDMRSEILREQEIITEMKDALRAGQFEVWFQPQYNHATGALIGSEALVRWRHPKRGLISPGVFIPIFEQNGFIYELDKYIWEAVCRNLRRWTAEGRRPLPVSVNVSRYDIFRADLVPVITGLLGKYSIPSSLMRLEITESAFAKSTAQIVAVVNELIAYGFTIEIDDFGSGYSSLNTLKSVPAQVLKLDMRFLEGEESSQRGGNILESIVRMTKWLGMSVIAEGVETREQADFLKSIGCPYIQGYLYAKPMCIGDYEKLCLGAEKEERLLRLETVENLDRSSFWDPASMDTLIFNGYVGGACIFEYHDGHEELIRANDKYAKVFGENVNSEDVYKYNTADYMDDENRKILTGNIERAIATGQDSTCETVSTGVFGIKHPVYIQSTVREIARAGDRHLLYCTVINTTEQREAEKKRQELAEQLRVIMASIDAGVSETVFEHGAPRRIMSNDHFYFQLGYTREQFEAEIGTVGDRIHDDDRADVQAAAARAREDGKPYKIEFRVIRRDGAVRWLRSSATITSLPGIELPVQLSVVTDVTEQREAVQKERRATEQAQSIMDDADSGITAVTYRNGKIEFLFSNDRYYQLLGYTRAQYADEIVDIYNQIHPEDRDRVHAVSSNAYSSGERARLDYRVICRDGSTRWQRALLSTTHFTGVDTPVQLCVVGDITAEKEAEEELRETDDQLRFLNEEAHSLLSASDAGEAVAGTLEKLNIYFGGDRAFIFEFGEKGKGAKNTYEVCAGGAESLRARRQEVPMSLLDGWMKIFKDGSFVELGDAARELHGVRAEVSEELAARGITSAVAIAMRRGDALIGFIAIDMPRINHPHADRLAALGDYIAMMLTRRDLDAKINSTNRSMTALMNDTPGGFVRMHVRSDGSIVPEYFNDGICRLLGMSREELTEIYSDDAFAGVHPDDLPAVQSAVGRLMENGEAVSSRYRVGSGSGEYIWVNFFGRVTRELPRGDTGDAASASDGEVFLNIYYTDASEQMDAERRQRELLDNLTFGAALYDFDGESFTVVHINRRYWELVGRPAVDYSEASVMNALHPDDRKPLMREIRSAIAENRCAECDIRLLNGEGGYSPFYNVCRIVPGEDGHFAVYASYAPLSEGMLSYREMLPVVLSAIMKSSTDLSFVKDRSLHYICASRAFAQMAGFTDGEEIVGKTDYDLFDRETADKYRADDERLIEQEQSIIDMVEQIPSDDGLPHISSTSKYLLRDGQGMIIGLYGVGRDITEYRDAFSRMKLLTDSIQCGLATFICTRESIRLSYHNEAFGRLVSASREEFERRAAENSLFMVVSGDIPLVYEQLHSLIDSGEPINCTVRVTAVNGEERRVNVRGALAVRMGEKNIINAVFLDVTEQTEAIERLRLSEEEYRLATHHSGNVICRYNIAERAVTMSAEAAAAFSLPQRIENVPEGPVAAGDISAEAADAYMAFYNEIRAGRREGTATFRKRFRTGWRWLDAHYSTIFSASGQPLSAVISYTDVTEQREKEFTYLKWQQSLAEKTPADYTLFRCNLSKGTSFDTVEGSLLKIEFEEKINDFDARTAEYVEKCVYGEDSERYTAFLDSDRLLAGYYRGNRSSVLEYREKLAEGVRWLRLTVDLVEYPNSNDIEAYLMYEDIDAEKRREIETVTLASTDPLTGILNRTAFAVKLAALLEAAEDNGSAGALLMLDLDGFKLVNDSFGHAAGDRVLIDFAAKLSQLLGADDLLCRLGGDEFLMAMTGTPAAVAKRAKAVCTAMRRSFCVEICTSASIGIAVYPADGRDFDTLYSKADTALYHVKATGKNNYAFYSAEMENAAPLRIGQQNAVETGNPDTVRRRMLIVEDNEVSRTMLTNIFKDDFIIDTASDGASALMRLRRYGQGISVVLLDLVMPGMDGFAVLEKMRAIPALRSIPVVVASSMEERETSLRVIRAGASDFVTKPYDPDLLRLRISSAISKAENRRLLAAMDLFAAHKREIALFRAAVESEGTVIAEYDPEREIPFSYDRAMSLYIAARFDSRPLLDILSCDRAADEKAIADLRGLIAAADGRDYEADLPRVVGTVEIKLKTPSGDAHIFRVRVVKFIAEGETAAGLLLTFTDTEL